MFKLDLEKAEEPEIKLPTSAGSLEKQESPRKTSISDITDSMDMGLGGLWESVMDRVVCCGSWGCKESDTTEQLNLIEINKC